MIENEPLHVSNCFGCNPKNPESLKMKFTLQADHVLGEFFSNQNHAGPPNMVHGGVIAALVDESFSILIRGLLKKDAWTIKEEISFRNPAPLGETIFVETRLQEEKSRTYIVISKVYTKQNTIAEAVGTMIKRK